MTTEKTLLPCPFCGGEAERIDFDGSGDNEGGSCIACKKCQSSGPVEFGCKENFVSNWNRRVGELCRAAPAGGVDARKFRGVGELERTGYIPAGSADERECKRCDGTGERYNNAAEEVTDCGACRDPKKLMTFDEFFEEYARLNPSASTAAGDVACPECKAPGLLFECVACSHSNYPQNSAPAGSGEVLTADAATLIRAKIHEWRTDALEIRESDHAHRNLIAEEYEAHADELEVLLAKKASPINGGAMVTDAMVAAAYDHLCGAGVIEDAGTVADDMKIMRAALEAALLRKLQQGAE